MILARFTKKTWSVPDFALVVGLARLVERFAADAIEAELGSPGKHESTAARVAVKALERERFQHRLAAAGADGERADRVGVLHDRVLRRVGPQASLLGRIDA